MKTYFFFTAMLFFSLFSLAQEGFVPVGEDASSGSGSVSYSIGQLAYQAYNPTGHIIIEGLQQPYTISGPLPVSILYFNATKCLNKTVNLNWSTTNEVNNDYFIIERSKDGLNFDSLKMVSAIGNSTTRMDYSSFDDNPFDGYSYYRLKQVDRDKQITYTRIERIYFEDTDLLTTIWPNPARDFVQVKISGEINKIWAYKLFDINGKSLEERVILSNITLINLINKSQGTYILQIVKAGKIIQSFKIIKSN